MSVLPAAGGSRGAGSHVAWGAALPQAGVTLHEETAPGAGVVRERVSPALSTSLALGLRTLPPEIPCRPLPRLPRAPSFADHGLFWRRCLWLGERLLLSVLHLDEFRCLGGPAGENAPPPPPLWLLGTMKRFRQECAPELPLCRYLLRLSPQAAPRWLGCPEPCPGYTASVRSSRPAGQWRDPKGLVFPVFAAAMPTTARLCLCVRTHAHAHT